MNNFEIKIDDETFIVDDISYEYSQLDSQNSGRSDDGTMYRDVIGLTNKISCDFKNRDVLKGNELSRILQTIKKTSCLLNYYELSDGVRVNKRCYIVADSIKINNIDGEFVAQPFQIRFIQMDVDNI